MTAKFQHYLNKGAVAMLGLITTFAGTQFSKLSDSVNDLGRQIAVNIESTVNLKERVTTHEMRLDAYDDRLMRLERLKAESSARKTQVGASPARDGLLGGTPRSNNTASR